MEQIHFNGFCEAKREELKNGRASSHRFRDAAHKWSFLGAGEQPLTHVARLVVDKRADVVKQFGRILNLVEYNGRLEFLKKGARIAAHSPLDVRVFE